MTAIAACHRTTILGVGVPDVVLQGSIGICG